jgi:hypothetical protein
MAKESRPAGTIQEILKKCYVIRYGFQTVLIFFPCLTIKSRHEYYSAVPRKQLTHAQYTRSMLVVLQIPMLMIPKKLTDSRTEYKAKLAGIAMVEHNRNLFLFCSLQELRLAFICLYFAISLHLLNRFVLNFNLFF